MGRAPCCDKQGLKKGPWTPEEDKILVDYIQTNGHGIWRSLPKQAGLLRCGKSCRLRWINYLRPDIKRGPFTTEEEKSISQLHAILGNKWAAIAAQLPGRTDNEVKNYWNTHLRKRLGRVGLATEAYAPSSPSSTGGSEAPASSRSCATRHMAEWESARVEAEARLSMEPHLPLCGDASASARGEPDFFLRMWHSEVGAAFRCRDAPASTSSKLGGSSPTPVEEGEEQKGRTRGEAEETTGAAAAAAGSSPGSNETTEEEETSEEEAYQMFLRMVGEDMALGCLFQGEELGSFSSPGWVATSASSPPRDEVW